MGLLTILGGIHPYEGKELSMEKPVREAGIDFSDRPSPKEPV